MSVYAIEANRFSGITENLYYDYNTVKVLYPYDFSNADHWLKRIDWLDANPGADKALVCEALMSLNRRLGAEEQTILNIRALSDKQCLAVVTGQQTGLFTGPLYTLYKAVTTIKQAKILNEKTGRPVVPVFWMATEDHDYAEIAMNWHFDGARVRRVRLSREHKANVPVGPLPITEELKNLCKDLCADLGTEENGLEMIELLSSSLAESTTVGDWFGRLLLKLFAPWGLVVLDPSDPGMRSIMKPYFRKALLETSTIQQAFKQGTLAVSTMDYSPEVVMGDNQTGLFLIDDGIRIPLYSNEEGTVFSDRHGKHHWTMDALLARLEATPEDFSTGVVLRPVVQDWLLPVAAAVLGPSEAAYHGQLGDVFEVFNRRLPIIVPRESWVLAPGADFLANDQMMELIGNSPEDWLSNQLMDIADNGLRSRVTRYNNEQQERFNGMVESLPVTSAVKEYIKARAAQSQERETKWLLKQIQKSLLANEENADKYHSFARMIKPLGKVQERTLLPWYFLSQFGYDLITNLITLDFSMDYRLYTGGQTN